LCRAKRFAGKYPDSWKHSVLSFTDSDGNRTGWGANLPRIGPYQFKDLEGNDITFDDSAGGMSDTLVVGGLVFFSGKRI